MKLWKAVSLLCLLSACPAWSQPSISVLDLGENRIAVQIDTDEPGVLAAELAISVRGDVRSLSEVAINSSVFTTPIADDSPFVAGEDETIGLSLDDQESQWAFAAFEGQVVAGSNEFLTLQYEIEDEWCVGDGVSVRGSLRQNEQQLSRSVFFPQIVVEPVVGDLNDDCVVNLLDLGILGVHFGINDYGLPNGGDVTGDGNTDLLDLGLLASVYDPDGEPGCCLESFHALGAVPEPANSVLVGGAIVVAGVGRLRVRGAHA